MKLKIDGLSVRENSRSARRADSLNFKSSISNLQFPMSAPPFDSKAGKLRLRQLLAALGPKFGDQGLDSLPGCRLLRDRWFRGWFRPGRRSFWFPDLRFLCGASCGWGNRFRLRNHRDLFGGLKSKTRSGWAFDLGYHELAELSPLAPLPAVVFPSPVLDTPNLVGTFLGDESAPHLWPLLSPVYQP